MHQHIPPNGKHQAGPQMMTPFQMANIIVQFYPWTPDTGELLNQLAAQRGQPHASELLGFSDKKLLGAFAAQRDTKAQQIKGHAARLLSIAEEKTLSAAAAQSVTHAQQGCAQQQSVSGVGGQRDNGSDISSLIGAERGSTTAEVQPHSSDVKPHYGPAAMEQSQAQADQQYSSKPMYRSESMRLPGTDPHERPGNTVEQPATQKDPDGMLAPKMEP